MLQITLQCAYCGSEDVRLPINLQTDELDTMTIKCKCGKWLVKDGIMGHKHNSIENKSEDYPPVG